jgi:hypothetical protein
MYIFSLKILIGSTLCGRKYGNFLVAVYFLMKIFYIANAIGQLFLLNEFLGANYKVYGFEVLQELGEEKEWTGSHRFPRVTY